MTERTSNRSLNPAGAYISGGAAGAEGVKIFRNKSRAHGNGRCFYAAKMQQERRTI